MTSASRAGGSATAAAARRRCSRGGRPDPDPGGRRVPDAGRGRQDGPAPVEPAHETPGRGFPDREPIWICGARRGLWHSSTPGLVSYSGEDGKVRFERRRTALHPTRMRSATYTITGDLITVDVVDGRQAGCAGKQLAAARVAAQHPGRCTSWRLSQDVQRRTWVLQRALHAPRGGFRPAMATPLVSRSHDEDWQPWPTGLICTADWLAGRWRVRPRADTGRDRTYVAAESGEVVDRGQWTVTDEPAAPARQLERLADCSEGDRLVLATLGYADPGNARSSAGRSEQNTCGGAWTPAVVVPHATEDS